MWGEGGGPPPDGSADGSSSLTELLAEADDDREDVRREADAHVEQLQVGQLHAQHLVHRGEDEPGVRLHAVLVEGAARARQPEGARRPPQRVVRPVHRDVCNTHAQRRSAITPRCVPPRHISEGAAPCTYCLAPCPIYPAPCPNYLK